VQRSRQCGSFEPKHEVCKNAFVHFMGGVVGVNALPGFFNEHLDQTARPQAGEARCQVNAPGLRHGTAKRRSADQMHQRAHRNGARSSSLL